MMHHKEGMLSNKGSTDANLIQKAVLKCSKD